MRVGLVELLSQGFMAKEIAQFMGVSSRTTEMRVHNILERLNARNSTHAVALWLMDGGVK